MTMGGVRYDMRDDEDDMGGVQDDMGGERHARR